MKAFTITITDDTWEPEDGDAMDALVDALECCGIPALIEEKK